MKNLLYLTILIFIAGLLSSCTNKQNICNIDLLVCNIPADAKLNNETKELLLPFEDSTGIILPQGIIFNSSDSVSYVKAKTWLENVRGNITKNTSILLLKEKISKHIADINLASLKKNTEVNTDFISNVSKNYSVVLGFGSANSQANETFHGLYFTKPEELINHLRDSVLLTNPQSKILIVCNPPTNSTSNGIEFSDETSSTLPNEEVLRQELLKIIDTKKTITERQQIAEQIWKEHFYQECYVDNYMDKNDKNPEYWGPKNGMKYLTEHLVTFPSIIDIKILGVERDKETQKVSGLKVCEIYNGSKFNN